MFHFADPLRFDQLEVVNVSSTQVVDSGQPFVVVVPPSLYLTVVPGTVTLHENRKPRVSVHPREACVVATHDGASSRIHFDDSVWSFGRAGPGESPGQY
jgi:hypothetical protein